MNVLKKILLYIAVSAFFYSCNKNLSPAKKPTTSTIGEYEEDLSPVRIRYENKVISEENNTDRRTNKDKHGSSSVDLPLNSNAKVDVILDSLAQRNKNIRYVQGYRIQVYVGNDRKEYDEARSFIIQNYPELSLYPSFNPPTYRLKAGDFTTKMDVERYFSNIKNHYSASMIVSDRIDIRKSMQIK
jgi:hypothetical protein